MIKEEGEAAHPTEGDGGGGLMGCRGGHLGRAHSPEEGTG